MTFEEWFEKEWSVSLADIFPSLNEIQMGKLKKMAEDAWDAAMEEAAWAERNGENEARRNREA